MMPQAGQLLQQRYQLRQRLAEHAGQQTWLATDRDSPSELTVVVKLLAMSPQLQWEEAKLLEREAQLLQKLHHPRIPRYCDYFLLEQLADSRFPWFCLVQSYVPGASLQQLLEQGHHFTAVEVERIASEALLILVYLHEFVPPLLHRDIKPSNLIWGADEHLYLIDFGSVQDQAALDGATFTVVGTYGYVPMEQFGGRAVPASDLYALGATLIHLLTGTAPADLPQHNARIQFAQQVSVDPAFVNWVSKLTEPDLAERLSTARQALEALTLRQSLSLPTVRRQPKGSQIRLQKTSQQLTIHVPPRGWQAVSWLYCLGVLGGSWTLLFQLPNAVLLSSTWVWLYLLLLVCPLLSLVLPAWSRTTIQCDRTHVTVRWRLFGLTFWRQRGQTTKIHPVMGLYEQEQPGVKGLMIQAGRTVLRTNPMAEVERHWLIQEIQDWLCLGQPQPSLVEGRSSLPFQGSRVRVQESAEALVIQYPGGEHYWTLATLPLLLLCLALSWVTWPWLSVLAPAASLVLTFMAAKVGGVLYRQYMPTTLRFNRDHFIADKKLWGYTWELFRGSNSQIDAIQAEIPAKLQAQGVFLQQLVIQTRSQVYPFGLGLTKPERHEIMRAINHWLWHPDQRIEALGGDADQRAR